jgi:RND superfamily putative drug exporter
VLSTVTHFDALIAGTVTMVGMGIGIDYSLFIVSRFREELSRSNREERSESERIADAVGVAIATSGRTILLSGVVVALSLASLYVVRMSFFQDMAIGGVTVVACTLVAAMTLLPATLAHLGPKLDKGVQQARARREASAQRGQKRPEGWARWALMIMRHPIFFATAAAAVLILAATPVLGLRSSIGLGSQAVSQTDAGKGKEALEGWFAAGSAAPIQIVLTKASGRQDGSVYTAAAKLTTELERTPLVDGVLERRGKSSTLLIVAATVPVDTPRAASLVRYIRKNLAPSIETRGGPTVLVGGLTAVTVDMADELHAKFPLVLALVLGLSLLFLLLVFRSIVLPIKAVLMNLLATGATMGIVVFVFQSGHGEHLLGFTGAGFIESYVPLIVFAVLFGLSMDYEVFLIRRMQEEWRRTHDNTRSVVFGIVHTARPITAAAAIMVAVFGCFVVARPLELKQFGFALAVAIALDATLVRLVLVPALMRLFGAWNWWLPDSLARVLPNISAD